MPLSIVNKMRKDCPCGSNLKYQVCCGRYHLGNLHPPTAEALMRARYSAYVLNKPDYIYHTWHEETRPDLQALRLIRNEKYIGLKILKTDLGREDDEIGTVTFVATYEEQNAPKELKEISSFKRLNKKWVYYKGEILAGC